MGNVLWLVIIGLFFFLIMRGAGCGMGHDRHGGHGDHAEEGDREDQKNRESCH